MNIILTYRKANAIKTLYKYFIMYLYFPTRTSNVAINLNIDSKKDKIHADAITTPSDYLRPQLSSPLHLFTHTAP